MNIKPLSSNELTALVAKYSPFFMEIRKRVFLTLSVFTVSTILGFVLYDKIIRFLIELLSLKGVNIVFTSPFQFINLAVSCGIATGLIITFPLLMAQVLHFFKPALKKREFKIIINFIPFSIILFLVGFVFGSIIMKWQIEIFLNSTQSLGIGNILDISSLLTTVFLTSAIMGIGFQFPIILLILIRISIITPQQLTRRRLWIYLASFIFALLLPLDSIIADIFLSLPLIILFELTLIINKLLDKNHSKKPSR